MRNISRVVGFFAAWTVGLALASAARADDERVVTEAVIKASVDDVWQAMTTKQGMESWKMREHFEAGNAWTMKKLQTKFAEAPSKPVPANAGGSGTESSPVTSAANLAPIEVEVIVSAVRAETWKAWATNQGAQAFFAPKTNIELRLGGLYEILFSPDNPPGKRGAEDLKVLSYLPMEMLSFEWSAPPQFASARPQRTWVVIRLVDAGEGRTRVRLTHLGFKERADAKPDERDEWVQVRQYFANAWPGVLANLKRRLDPASASP